MTFNPYGYYPYQNLQYVYPNTSIPPASHVVGNTRTKGPTTKAKKTASREQKDDTKDEQASEKAKVPSRPRAQYDEHTDGLEWPRTPRVQVDPDEITEVL